MSDTVPQHKHGLPRAAFIVLPLGVAALALLLWHAAVKLSGSDIFPTPLEVLKGLGELARQGLLLRYVVASIFRVTWGFGLTVLVNVPLGLTLD